MEPASKFKRNNRKCYFPWFSSWVDADGTVRPCPIIPWQRNVACMGNAFDKPFNEIWNNKDYQQLRTALSKGERPTEPCETCIPKVLLNILYVRTRMLPWRS